VFGQRRVADAEHEVFLVVDPQQLPPTVISTKAESVGYNQSLFVRMVQGHPDAMHLLRWVLRRLCRCRPHGVLIR
jgi:superfamily I DNA and/or RNA helicase